MELPTINLPLVSLPNLDGSKKLIISAVTGILILIFIVVFLVTSLLKNLGPVTITYWGLWEDPSVFQQVISDYKRTHSNVTIKYVKQSPLNYRERALSSIEKNDGPDIVRIHNTWLPIFAKSLAPFPKEILSSDTFRSSFYPVTSTDLFINGRPYAIPLEIDTLGLYINQDLFTAGGGSIPKTWDEFEDTAQKLTVKDQSGKIKTSGAAMGTASNVDHWQDIVSLMILQSGVNPTSPTDLTKSDSAATALNFYVGLSSTDNIWDETLDPSTLAFAQGKVAMYFAPSWRYFDIKAINPSLNFKVVPVPQLTGSQTTNFASYWAEAVSKNSKHQKESMEFLKFLASEEALSKIYSAQAKLRAFGEPYPRPKMASMLSTDPAISSFVLAAPTAKSSYLSSATFDGDTGLNSRIANYYRDAINSMLRGSDAKSALDTVSKGLTQVLQSYGIANK